MRAVSIYVLGILLAASLAGCAAPTGVHPSGPVVSGRRAAVMATARSQLGRPYRYAGESPEQGFDCSGFVQWVFARQGVRLPRSTKDQARNCRPVSWGELQAGDLVFFTPSFKTSELHVGIFDGQGDFIHSPSPGGRVREESIMSPYWRTAYYKGCRVLP